MSRHQGVSCDNCLESNLKGKRFKCLICYDYDLCEHCHSFEMTTDSHLSTHPMQCILTRTESELYYAGESISPDMPPSLVCPLCCRKGFTESLLREHVLSEHKRIETEVICPICVSLPSIEPSVAVKDLSRHLALEHRPTQNVDGLFTSRHVRHRGVRARTFRGSNFSSASGASLSTNNNTSSSSREPSDPIIDILSQLTSTRDGTAQQLQSPVTISQLREMQTQLNLERQRANGIRQQQRPKCAADNETASSRLKPTTVMSLRKRKFSNTSLSRSATNKSRSGTSTATVPSSTPTQPSPPTPPPLPPSGNEPYQSFVLNVVDQAVLGGPELIERNPPSSFATVLQSAHVGTEDGNKSPTTQATHPIPLPPPMPEGNLKAAGILAELITLRGTHIATANEPGKGKKAENDRLVDRSVHSAINQPSVLERFPNKFSGNPSGSQNIPPSGFGSKSSFVTKKQATPRANEDDEARYLLSSLDKLTLSESEKRERESDDIERSEFVQELLLSMLAIRSSNTELATPIQCPVSSSPAQGSNQFDDQWSGGHVTKSDQRDESVVGRGHDDHPSRRSPDFEPRDDTRARAGSPPPSSPQPPAGARRDAYELTGRGQFSSLDFDNEKDADDEKPPSPRQHAIRLQDLVYPPGSARLSGVSDTAVLPGYGREDLTASDGVGKHVQ